MLERELGVVPNNLANINTTGYKADSSIFEQFLKAEASADAFPLDRRDLACVRDAHRNAVPRFPDDR